jgi:hypothetical protein
MDQLKVKAELDHWLVEFVEATNPQLGNWAPCPYAKAARLSGMISTKFCEVSELYDVVRESIETLEHKDVVVVCFDHHMIDPVELQEVVSGMNKMLMPVNYVILEDHPDAPEYVNQVKMNFGHCGLLVLQKLDKLNNAADKLRAQGYYNTWEQREIDEVVTWRYET